MQGGSHSQDSFDRSMGVSAAKVACRPASRSMRCVGGQSTTWTAIERFLSAPACEHSTGVLRRSSDVSVSTSRCPEPLPLSVSVSKDLCEEGIWRVSNRDPLSLQARPRHTHTIPAMLSTTTWSKRKFPKDKCRRRCHSDYRRKHNQSEAIGHGLLLHDSREIGQRGRQAASSSRVRSPIGW